MDCLVSVYLVSSLLLCSIPLIATVASRKFEYTINQGVAPTLIYPVPTPKSSPVFGRIIHSIRDYYPLWQVRLSASLPASRNSSRLACVSKYCISLPLISLYWATGSSNTCTSNTLHHPRMPFNCTCIGVCARIFSRIAGYGFCLSPHKYRRNMRGAFVVSTVPPFIKGLSRLTRHSVNAYFRAGQEPAEPHERAFKMGAIGLADSLGILAASLVAMPTEIALCRAQVGRGQSLCREL